jgi:C-terminal processing protease CtpA/Prc
MARLVLSLCVSFLALFFAAVGTPLAPLTATAPVAVEQGAVGNEPARPLTARGLENLTAFTRLLGYVRYFHPGDAVAKTDWEAFALHGVRAVEDAATPEELAARLDRLFRPIAPTVRIFPTGHAPEVPRELLPPADGPAPKSVAWRHFGVAVPPPPGSQARRTIYSSERVDNQTPLRGKEKPPVLPAPAETFAADLGGGVSCRVPLSLYADAQGATLPPTPDPALPPSGRPEGWAPSGNDRATRLADVVLAWNIFQHFYPYFDVVQTDWPAALQDALRSAATDRDDTAFLDTLRLLVARLQDGHGNVYRPVRGEMLPLAWAWADSRVVVSAAAPEVSALVRPGEALVSIDGVPAEEALRKLEERISGATPQWRRYVALLRLGVGPAGEKVSLVVEPLGGSPRPVSLGRVPLDKPLEEPRPEKMTEIQPGIWYVDLGRISDEDFKAALPRLAEAKGIVFDLRGYPNLSTVVLAHLTDKPVSSARWHVPIVMRPDREGMEFDFANWEVEPEEPRLRAKVAFLTDGRAISYAETYMGIVEHYKLAEIVGSPTAGTNGNINPFQLPGGYNIVWTGMKVLKHDGSRHHGVGILPTIPAEPTRAGIAAGRDDVLEKGISVVAGEEGTASR